MSAEGNPRPDFDGDRLRQIMRRVATPVTVVTFVHDGRPRGVTIGSFTSVSLTPPLVAFNVDRKTTANEPLEATERLVINVLSEEQAFLANHFALSDLSSAEQFEPVQMKASVRGIPLIDGTVAALECEIRARHRAGDSIIVVSEVVEGRLDGELRPLLYYNRTYREVGQEREPSLFAPVNRSSSGTP